MTVEASCAEIIGSGTGSVTYLGVPYSPASMLVAGPSTTLAWEANAGTSLVASGAFAWTDTLEITNCLTTGITTVDLWGAFAVVA